MITALSFGEIVWDIIRDTEHLGGAPLNLAAHLAQMGCAATMVSRTGDDRLGRAARDALGRLGVDASLVQRDPQRPTGFVDVALDAQGNPTFTIHPDVAYDFIEFDETLARRLAAERFDVFCFGTLCQRSQLSRDTLRRILAAVRAHEVFYDVNIRQHYYSRQIVADSLAACTILKLNDSEHPVLSGLLFGRDLAEADFARRVRDEFSVGLVCVTKGAGGCTIHHAGRRFDSPGLSVEVADTVGSGDAFSAAFLFKHCGGADPARSAEAANRIGAFVASQSGAIPEYPDEIRALLKMEQ